VSSRSEHHRSDLVEIARQAMTDRGLAPDFSAAAEQQLESFRGPAGHDGLPDRTGPPWCSIDNDDSRDLDQLSVAESLSGGSVRILVAVADVDALVSKGCPIDDHARQNTTSVYTAAQIFPMLPEQLSTGWTSLNPGEDRAALVIGFTVASDGSISDPEVSRASVRNKAKLAYSGVGAWLEDKGPLPDAAAQVPSMDEQLRIQDRTAQRLRQLRFEHGALELETIQPRTVFDGDRVVDLKADRSNRAKQLIEEFMIAANEVTARFLSARRASSLRRVVRTPEQWPRIVEVAREAGDRLPDEPDSKALEEFLARRRRADPLRFPDLSLVIVKLLGRGEYVVERRGQAPIGHFGLALKDYTHSTAPNRRFPDLITERQTKAVLAGSQTAYADSELEALAARCTQKEDDADKVERQVRKSAAALLLESRIGQRFDAVVTGASEKGTWVRVLDPPVEGKLVQGWQDARVGQKLRVKLISTDFEKGFIDFARTV
jgi:exoribonuclease-2